VTVHFISVGLGVVEEFLADPWRRLGSSRPELAETIDRSGAARLVAGQAAGNSQAASRWLAQRLGPPSPAHERLAELARQIRPDLWPKEASAELQTFAGAAHSQVLARDDIAILLATDTVDGLAAALWNAVALVGGDLGRVRYLADPADRPTGVRGCAVMVRVPSLDARNHRGFRIAMGGLGRLGRNLVGVPGEQGVTNPGEPFRFYLSGGFKAAIPYLIGLAEALRSLERGHPVEAFVLHETTDADPIPLPLRRLPAELVRSELAGFDQDGHYPEQERTTNFLEGYAYEKGEQGWELTAFGEGLRVLFGPSPEVTSG
jgi:hypothetical protein